MSCYFEITHVLKILRVLSAYLILYKLTMKIMSTKGKIFYDHCLNKEKNGKRSLKEAEKKNGIF